MAPFGLLDEREHVAHAEDARHQSIRLEQLELRRSSRRRRRSESGRCATERMESAAPPRVSPSILVSTGTGEIEQGVTESGPHCLNGVLTGHRIADEEAVRFGVTADPHQ